MQTLIQIEQKYATVRLSDKELVKQAKSKAALEGITLLALVERALRDYLTQSTCKQ